MKKVVLKCLIAGLMVSVLNTGVVAFADEIKAETETVSESSGKEENVVEFKDKNLKFGITSALNISLDSKITTEMLEGLTELDLSAYDVYDLTPLQYCINLEKVDLSNNKSLMDFSPLNNLAKLKELKASNTEFWDLNQIENLKSLEVLELKESVIKDLSPISNLTNLKYLNLDYSKNPFYEELAYIKELKNLEELSMVGSSVKDVSFLENLTNLKKINLSKNYISNVSVFKELINNGNLTDLNLEQQSIFLDIDLEKKDVITIPINVSGINGNNLEITALNEGITYLKDSYAFQIDVSKSQFDYESCNEFPFEFKDTSSFEGVNYNFSGILVQYVEFKGENNNIKEETNTESKVENKNKPSTKTSTPKTADPGAIGVLGMLGVSLSTMILAKKKK